jgi:hypothetical protein
MRSGIARMPHGAKNATTDLLAAAVYWPLARVSWLGEKLGLNTESLPLHSYRNSSFYTMRTDSRDRFGTPLEQRFTREQIRAMMEAAGLRDVVFSENEPYWHAVGTKCPSQ